MKKFTAILLSLLMMLQAVPFAGLAESAGNAAEEAGTIWSDWYTLPSDPAGEALYRNVQFTVLGETVATLSVADGATVEALPEAPTLLYMSFVGWYDGNTPFTAETPVTGDMVVRGVYTKANPVVEALKLASDYMFEDTGDYVAFSVFGTHKKNQKPSAHKASVDAKDGLTVTDAWTVDNIKNNSRLMAEAVVTSLPAGGSLIAYGIVNGRLGDPLGDPLAVGDKVLVDLTMKGLQGVAFVTDAAPAEEEEPVQLVDSGMLYANEGLYITGKVPGSGVIDVQPVKVSVNGAEALAAYDIKIYANENQQAKGKAWQPADKKVKVHFYNEAFADKQLDVYHLADEKSPAEFVASVQAENGWITFDAASFSVYAVVDGATGDNARITIRFWGGDDRDELIATMYVKESDSANAILDIVYDPGVGVLREDEIFRGWIIGDVNGGKPTYTPADAHSDRIKTIDDVRTLVQDLTITEGDTLDIVAALYNAYNITYLDPFEIALTTDGILIMPNQHEAAYTISTNYEPIDDTHLFEGWYVKEGGTHIQGYDASHLYRFQENITVTGDVVFSATQALGHWLIFNQNGKGATYNAPQFVRADDVTVQPSLEMIRNGYSFDGWYYFPDGNPPAPVDGEVDLTNAQPFTFGGELEDKTNVYAKWSPIPNADFTIIIWKQNLAGDGYDFSEAVHRTGPSNTAILNNYVRSQGTGSNAYIQIKNQNNNNWTSYNNGTYSGFHLSTFDQDKTISPEGNTVVNVYYDRNEYTLSFQVYGYTYTVSTGDNDNNPVKYGDVNGQKARIYWRNGAFRTSDRNNGTVYTGTVYTRSSGESWHSIKDITALYEQNIVDQFPIVGSDGITYNNGERWDPQSNNQGWDEVMVIIETMPNESITFRLDTENRPLKTMNYYVEALPTDTDTITFRGTRYTLYRSIDARYNGVTKEDFIELDGFVKNTWADVNGNSNAYSNTFYIYSTTQDQTINFYYFRENYKINYMDGVYVDGNGNRIDETSHGQWATSDDIQYQADISSYNKGGANYYAPQKTGYVFDGWYIDSACTHPYTFTTMPKGGVTVYAKWRQVEYRVFFHPRVPNSDTSLYWGSDSQDMNFRVALGGKVSLPTGTRTEYEFVGWYRNLNLSADSLFMEDTVLNESTVTTPYDKTTDFTDPMDKYGEGATYNNDDEAHQNRFWITKKLDLYAKWRKVLEGADGIGVRYIADPGANPPTDPHKYVDTAMATAYPPPNDPPEGYTFLYWVLQHWNGTEYEDTDIYVYPGDTFEVLKDDSRQLPDDPPIDEHGKNRYTYTVQLRAEYKPIEDPKPTHIWWYMNDPLATDLQQNLPDKENTVTETGDTTQNMFINEAVDIKDAPTKKGYTFIGWARLPISETGSTANENNAGNLKPLLNEEDLYLKYEDGVYKVQTDQDADGDGENDWVEVSSVAADEETPYHDMYAVWEKYTDVPVEKIWEPVVDGVDFSAFETDTITVELKWNGNSYDPAKTAVLSASDIAANNWKYTFTDLPTRDSRNKKIRFTIEEVVPDGWSASYDPAYVVAMNKYNTTMTLHVTNTPIYGSIISLEKTVAGLEEDLTAHLTAPSSGVTFTVKGPRQEDNSYKNTYTFSLSDFTKTDNGDGTYTYTLEPEELAFVEAGEYIFYEENADTLGAWGYALTAGEGTSDANPVTITLPTAKQATGAITNTYERTTGTLIVSKTVAGHADGAFPYTVKIKNAENWWLKQDKTLTANESEAYAFPIPRTEGTLTGTLTLSGIPTGTYTVVEQGTEEDGSAQIQYYALETTYEGNGAEVTSVQEGTVGVTNTYTRTTVPVTLKKLVDGNQADVNKMFPFTLQLVQEDGETPLVIDGLTDEQGNLLDEDDQVMNVSLKHGQTANLGQLPIGAKLKITEGDADDYNTAYKADGTDPSFPIETDTKEAVITIPELTGSMTSVDIVFGNYANLVIPTGVRLDMTPYLVLMALALLGAAGLLIRRRKENG